MSVLGRSASPSRGVLETRPVAFGRIAGVECNVNEDAERPSAGRFLTYAFVTFAVLVVAFAAFDDITTGKETDFTLEYVALLGSAIWLLFTAVHLVRSGYRVLGGASLIVLACALWAQRGIGSGITSGRWPEYVVMAAAFVWFTALSIILVWMGELTLSAPSSVGRTK